MGFPKRDQNPDSYCTRVVLLWFQHATTHCRPSVLVRLHLELSKSQGCNRWTDGPKWLDSWCTDVVRIPKANSELVETTMSCGWLAWTVRKPASSKAEPVKCHDLFSSEKRDEDPPGPPKCLKQWPIYPFLLDQGNDFGSFEGPGKV